MKRQSNRLTAAAVKSATKDKCDGYGLWLQVSRYGTKSWLFRFMIDGRPDSMGLGPLNTVSLARAREKAEKVRDLLEQGINPREARDAERRQRKLEAAKAITFKQCADRYIEANRAAWKNAKHADQWFATFNQTKRGSTVFPAATEAINDLPVSAIDTGLILNILELIWQKTPESASRIRGRIERVLDWARVRGYREGENPARWEGHLKETLPARRARTRGHHAAVPYAEVPAFLAELRKKAGISARALELTILTAARTAEAIGARWSEIDLQARLWVIGPERMKGAREHRVPLSDRALEILSSLPRDSEFVFPGARAMKPLSDMAMLKVVRGMRGQGSTVHGFRSTFKDWAGETTSFPNELTEIALAHAISDKTDAAYRRGDMMEKRRRLMADWAAYCGGQHPASRHNVVGIRETAG
jgi:integrase